MEEPNIYFYCCIKKYSNVNFNGIFPRLSIVENASLNKGFLEMVLSLENTFYIPGYRLNKEVTEKFINETKVKNPSDLIGKHLISYTDGNLDTGCPIISAIQSN